ncbi:MAG TPA: ABC transporter substrate-binding protein, partial [Allocoleopsis sp.]
MKLLALKKSKPVVLIFIAALAAFLCLFIIRNKGSFAMAKPENRVVRVALPSKWKLPLYPASQHSMIEDAILANQFESLVKRGENGLILPSAAKAYKFNDDFTIYDFEIDQTRMFSDGSPVTADDFKRSWEEGLRLAQNSSNKNLNDMLSLAVGFDEFAQVGHIAGVEALSPSHLRIRFQKPFRMALMHLTGARFAAFKKDNETFIGTGKYIITPQQDESLQLSLNPHHKIDDGLDSIQIVYFDDPLPVLERGDIDLIAFYTKKVEGKENIKSTIGVEDASMWLYVNGLKGRIFADQELRLGFQSLVFRALKNCDEKIRKMPVNFKLDNQTFLPLQAGRLSSERANELVAKGDQYIDRLLDLSKKHPLKLAISDSFAFLREELRLQGLNFDNKTYPSFLDHLDEFYH